MSGSRRRPRHVSRALSVAVAMCAVLVSGCSPEPVLSPDPGTMAASQKETSRCLRTLVGVAHPDDDLFFLNPEIMRTIRAGCPVDTIYLTAGDDAIKNRVKALEYVDRREYGVRSAYAAMAEAANRWDQSDVQSGGFRVRSFRLADRARSADVRLTFLDLHDGLPQGQEANSVLRLYDANRQSVYGFLGGVSFSEERLLTTLSGLVRRSRAERILTMDHDNASFAFGLGGGVDHSDHGITARYFRRVGYALGVPVTSYPGTGCRRSRRISPPDRPPRRMRWLAGTSPAESAVSLAGARMSSPTAALCKEIGTCGLTGSTNRSTGLHEPVRSSVTSAAPRSSPARIRHSASTRPAVRAEPGRFASTRATGHPRSNGR